MADHVPRIILRHVMPGLRTSVGPFIPQVHGILRLLVSRMSFLPLWRQILRRAVDGFAGTSGRSSCPRTRHSPRCPRASCWMTSSPDGKLHAATSAVPLHAEPDLPHIRANTLEVPGPSEQLGPERVLVHDYQQICPLNRYPSVPARAPPPV